MCVTTTTATTTALVVAVLTAGLAQKRNETEAEAKANEGSGAHRDHEGKHAVSRHTQTVQPTNAKEPRFVLPPNALAWTAAVTAITTACFIARDSSSSSTGSIQWTMARRNGGSIFASS